MTPLPQSPAHTPTNATELQALAIHRSELRDQLRLLDEQAGQLMQQRLNAQATNSRREVTQLTERIEAITARVPEIEAQIRAADASIADALRRGVGTEEGVPLPPPPPSTIVLDPGFGRFGPNAETRAVVGVASVVGLALLLYAAWKLGFRKASNPFTGAGAAGAGDRQDLRELRSAVDAIAIEVERISENQRFVTALLNERTEKAALPKDPSGR